MLALARSLVAFALMALCVTIHAMGLIAVFRRMHGRLADGGGAFWPSTAILIRVAAWTMFLHLLQIAAWAFLYTWLGVMPDLNTAAYFSVVTYTTTGYGDLVLRGEWRLVGGVEALTGILMCGLSTGMFFAVFSKIFHLDGHQSTKE